MRSFIVRSLCSCLVFLAAAMSAPGLSSLEMNTEDRELIKDLEHSVPELMEKAAIPGLSIAVIRGGQIIWFKGFGVQDASTGKAVSDDTVFEAGSLSKPVFAYAVMQLVDKGVLGLDTPLMEYLPEKTVKKKVVGHSLSKEGFRLDWFRNITARMVLSHSSGMTRRDSRETFPLLSEPGSKFKYSAEGFMYLQLVIEHLTGKEIDEIMNEYVIGPLQMNNSSFVWKKEFENKVAVGHDMIGGTTGGPTKHSHGNAAASLYTTAGDYARFMVAIMNGTRLKGGTLNEMLIPRIGVERLAYGAEDSHKDVSWGLGFGIERTSKGDAFFHWGDTGSSRNYAVGFKDPKIGVVYLTNSFNGLSIGRDLIQHAIGSTDPGLYWLSYLQHDSAPLMLIRTVLTKGTKGVASLYPDIREKHPDGFNEFMLNAYICELLRLNRVNEAIVLFEQVVQSFPESWVLQKSLAEAFMKKGDKELAARSYEKVLKLNPNDAEARQMLKKLKKHGK